MLQRDDSLSYKNGVEFIQASLGVKEEIKQEHAQAYLTAFYQSLLDNNRYEDAAFLQWGPRTFDPRSKSVKRIWQAIDEHDKLLCQGGGAQGKCLGKGTPVLMFDGSIKAVEDIVVGDQLMGDNSDAREVLQLHRGRSPIVRITPSAGDPWICTANHMMTLVCAEDKMNGDGKTINSVRTKGNVIDIALDTFQARGKSFRGYWRLFSRGVEFKSKSVEFDSYIYGMWLGDGGVNHPVLHNCDPILINRWCDYFKSRGYRIAINSTLGRSCSGYFARWMPSQGGGQPNPFKDFVRASYINGEKRIRRDYLINDREVRMQLLAGLIDTDGYAEDAAFSITTKYIGLRNDIVYLARSLGFKTSAHTVVKYIKSLGFKGTYYNVRITGLGVKDIPTLLKKVKRVQKQGAIGTTFKIEDIGEDDYYGFELDGNRRFLLGDFTVTHNTYTATVKFLLRWSEDPQHTSVKLVSTSGGHAKSNIFAGFVKLHNEAVIPLPGFIRESYIGIDINEVQWSIQKVSIGKGEDGTAALRGFHRLPRKTPHPKFGDMSVVFVIVDEADNVPWGFWKGADNIASGAGGKGTIKIYAATNPMLIESEFSSRAQPLNGGRGSIDKDKTFEWEGQQGWHVIRLDVRQSENYKEKKEIYQGMMTYESARDYLSKGLDHPDVSTFIYGLYPQASAKYYVVPAFILEDIRGTYNFIKTPVNLASFDPAFEQGGDRAVLTAARYGLANGWRAPNGKLQAITPPRNVLALEQQLEIEKTANPLDMADNLIEVLKRLRVQPEWFVHDMTGNATLLYAYLLRKYGAVMGLKWGSGATESRVFAEDRETAEEQFVGLISEMWVGFSRWAQFGYVKIAPMMQTQELFNELSSRKYEQASKTRMLVESKDEFKKNNGGKSPDWSDSLIMAVHLCRVRGQESARLITTGDTERPLPPDFYRGEDWSNFGQKQSGQLTSVVDTIPFINFEQ